MPTKKSSSSKVPPPPTLNDLVDLKFTVVFPFSGIESLNKSNRRSGIGATATIRDKRYYACQQAQIARRQVGVQYTYNSDAVVKQAQFFGGLTALSCHITEQVDNLSDDPKQVIFPKPYKVLVLVEVFPPVGQRFDMQNFDLKALWDGMADACVYDDDGQIWRIFFVRHKSVEKDPRIEFTFCRVKNPDGKVSAESLAQL